MSEDLLPKAMAEFKSKGFVIAPAGYGKTHLIALAVKEASDRQLILTHTFAGVNSIKAKLNKLKVPSSKYQVETIASWTLRLCLAYPKLSGWTTENPTSEQWSGLYYAAHKLLAMQFIRHVVSCTYSGIYVDEYQDCSNLQHTLICAFTEFLPCRILGDPLQAIFDFGDKPVDWEKDIFPTFENLGELQTPWRWKIAGAPELGDWLKKVRDTLKAGEKVNLTTALPIGVIRISVAPQELSRKQIITLKYWKKDGTTIALHAGDAQSKNKTHNLARNLGGKFSSIEEVEGKVLFSFIKELQVAKTVNKGFLAALEFIRKCFAGVDKALVAGTKKANIAKPIASTKKTLIPILDAANTYLSDPTSRNLRDFFHLIRDNPDTVFHRRDLFNRLLNILKIHIDGEALTLLQAAEMYQVDFRHSGRPIRHTRLIGTTLLVKGLEYDHAVILDGDSLDMKGLYVAMTRGSKSLTIISNKGLLPTF